MERGQPDIETAVVRVRTPEVGMIVLDEDRREVVLQLFDGRGPLPQVVERMFAMAYANMTAVRVELTAGPGSTRDEVVVIGTLELTGLPPRDRGAPLSLRVERTEGFIDAELVEVQSGRSERLRVAAVLLA